MSVKFKKRMAKMKKKLGFTLIEMLIVIAIIAILVSIITPAVTSYTTKANAATNAANLRAVKATLSIKLLSGEIDYFKAQTSEQLDAYLDDAIEEATEAGNDALVRMLRGFKLAKDAATIVVNRAANTYYGNTEGTMDVDGDLISAPVSKAVKIDGLTLRAGTAMAALVTDTNIMVTYGGIPLEVFEIIAKEGDNANIDMTQYQHYYIDSNGDGDCDICGVASGDPPHDAETGQVGDALDNIGTGGHVCTSADDHYCDDPECGLRIEAHKITSTSHECGYTDCSEIVSTCNRNQNLDATYHCCSICGENKQEHDYMISATNTPLKECQTCGAPNPNYVQPKCEVCNTDISSGTRCLTHYSWMFCVACDTYVAPNHECENATVEKPCSCTDGKFSFSGKCGNCGHPLSEHDGGALSGGYGKCNHVDYE